MEKQNKLIIFDCDGVLVDSEPLSNRTIASQMQELGITMTEEEAILLFAGGSLKNVTDYVKEATGREAPADMEEVYRLRSYELFRKELQAVPGIKTLLEQIPNKKCVASNGPIEKMKLNLQLTGLTPFFDENLFSAYEVGHWKPDPRLFLHAAMEMGFEARDCIVIEDSDHGIHAAKAAGMQVYGFAGRTPREKLERAGAEVFYEMGALAVILGLSI
ncbi:MAG: HAD superfamily hydrolase (TIGR01509 family) [Saprospiraceae bacterium]|jgi:HAD superfamily hydrolase (TIGR01509 family)